MLTKNSTQTKNFAKRVASGVLKSGLLESGATVLALQGDLGTGKTTFVQGFARVFGVKTRVISPTFLIFRKYKIPPRYTLQDIRYTTLYHVDLYRIKSVKELDLLGFKEILKDNKNIVLIEWAEKVRKSLPQHAKWIYFKHGKNKNERDILIT